MRPTKAKDHHAAGAPCGPPSVSWQAPVPAEETRANASPESDQGPLQDGTGVCPPAGSADVYAIDADVPLTGRRARSVVARRVADDEVDHGTLTSLALGGRVSHVNAGRTG